MLGSRILPIDEGIKVLGKRRGNPTKRAAHYLQGTLAAQRKKAATMLPAIALPMSLRQLWVELDSVPDF
jgi:hypothetical protein